MIIHIFQNLILTGLHFSFKLLVPAPFSIVSAILRVQKNFKQDTDLACLNFGYFCRPLVNQPQRRATTQQKNLPKICIVQNNHHSPPGVESVFQPHLTRGLATTPGSSVAQQHLSQEAGRQSESPPQKSHYQAWSIPVLCRQGD